MNYKVCLLNILICLFFSTCFAQLQKFIPPNSNYTSCPYGNFQDIEDIGVAAHYSYCPPETLCVNWQYPSRVSSNLVDAFEIVFSSISAPGCCSHGAPSPCFTGNGISSISGCCPVGKHCCVDPYDDFRLIGCAISPVQCCGSSICPDGFSCCFTDIKRGRYCCPGVNGCNPILNETASQESSTNLYKFVPNSFPRNGSVLFDTRFYSPCMNVNENSTDAVPFIINATFGEAYPCGRNGSWCRGEEYIAPGNNETLGLADYCADIFGNVLDPFNDTLIEERGAFCCPNGTEVCLMGGITQSGFITNTSSLFTSSYISSLSAPRILGCANTLANETCCSRAICSNGNKCCRFDIPPSWDSSPVQNVNQAEEFVVNATLDIDICCPDGTFCCAKIVPVSGAQTYFDPDLSINNPEVARARFEHSYIYTYCGRNENCTSSAQISEMYQIAPSLSKSGFLPDYIEGIGWLDDPILYFSPQILSVAPVDSTTYNDKCRIYSGDQPSNYDFCGLSETQEDQCQFNG